ncbi:MAG TPA: ABC-2 family transporter protein [Gemmatimonadaceae bacterium]
MSTVGAPRATRSAPRLLRALSVLRALWRVNVAEEMQYRANFVASLLGTIFWIAMALLTIAIFFRHTATLGGWDYWEVVALLGIFNALTGMIEAVMRPGVGRLAEEVRSGTLDLVLSRPVDAQLFVSFRRLDLWRFTDVVLGLGLTGVALVRLGQIPSATRVVAFVITFAAAVGVVYAIWVALMSLAFRFVAVENISVLFDAVFEGARYPVTAYPGALRFLFVYLIPIAWTTTIPASTLVGRLRPGASIVAALVGAAAIGAARLLWRAALRKYTSAGG